VSKISEQIAHKKDYESVKVCLVVGAGDATGAAVARRFARERYTVCVVRRKKESLTKLVEEIQSNGGHAVAFGCDARQESEVVDLISRIESDIGPIEIAVHNIGANVRFGIAETTARVYRKVWEMAAFSAFLTGREVAKAMKPRQRGTIIFTGATASIRGKDGFAAFSGAKHATRALSQAMARELGPIGIHVAHVVVDGPIDTAFISGLLGESRVEDMRRTYSILNPNDIADSYWFLHTQPPSAWTWELDLRPWTEPF